MYIYSLHLLRIFHDFLDERWMSMEKIWTENSKRKSMPSGVLPLHSLIILSCEETGRSFCLPLLKYCIVIYSLINSLELMIIEL
jgi:hypothetical protein